MKRYAAATSGALLVLVLALASFAFAVQERNLSDAPPPAPATGTAPAVQAPAAPQSPEAEVQTAPQAPAEAPAVQEAAPAATGEPMSEEDRKKYNRQEVQREVEGFFENGSEGLAEIVSRPFEKYGKPNGYIKGNEGSGALIVGFRYGSGMLYMKGKKPVKVYWQSPSLGFDIGANASKVFTLVYNMEDPNQIFQRFPGVNGSAYIIGGFGMTYLQSGDVVLAPIRFGVGLRLGANVGYQDFTREATMNPF